MNALRTVVSALSIVVGVVVVTAWALAHAVVSAIEDGTAARAITEQVLDSPAIMGAVTDDLSARTAAALQDWGIDVAAVGLDGHLDEVISRAVGSPVFHETLLNQVDGAHAQIAQQLAEPDREPAPLNVSVDLSDSINTRIGDLGGLAVALPALDIPPVTISVLEAERFEQAREAYATAQWLQTWGLWLGMGAFVIGVLVSHRRRWFVAKALFALAAACFAVAGAVTFLGPDTLAGLVPGGEEGVWGAMWRDVIGEHAGAVVTQRALIVGGLAVVGALIAVAIAISAGRKSRLSR